MRTSNAHKNQHLGQPGIEINAFPNWQMYIDIHWAYGTQRIPLTADQERELIRCTKLTLPPNYVKPEERGG